MGAKYICGWYQQGQNASTYWSNGCSLDDPRFYANKQKSEKDKKYTIFLLSERLSKCQPKQLLLTSLMLYTKLKMYLSKYNVVLRAIVMAIVFLILEKVIHIKLWIIKYKIRKPQVFLIN